jgi:hypothetical protein
MVFYYLKQMEKRLKTRAQYWAGNRPGATVSGPTGPVQPRRRLAARERGALRTHSRRGHHVVATRAAEGRRGWLACSGGQGVLEKVV